jgi:hypothetical protein
MIRNSLDYGDDDNVFEVLMDYFEEQYVNGQCSLADMGRRASAGLRAWLPEAQKGDSLADWAAEVTVYYVAKRLVMDGRL